MTGVCGIQTHITETSVWSYHEVKDSADHQDQVTIVEDIIKCAGEVGVTDFEIRARMRELGFNIPPGSVSARRNDINDRHERTVIVHKGYKKNLETGKNVRLWVFSDPVTIGGEYNAEKKY